MSRRLTTRGLQRCARGSDLREVRHKLPSREGSVLEVAHQECFQGVCPSFNGVIDHIGQDGSSFVLRSHQSRESIKESISNTEPNPAATEKEEEAFSK